MRTFDDLWSIAKDIPGWFDIIEGKALYNIVSSLKKDSIIIELGSFCGRSSVIIAGLTQGKSIPRFVDDFSSPGCSLEILEKNLKRVSLDYLIKPMKSDQAFKDISAPIDLLFIDTVHTYEAVKHDINLWIKKIKQGGYILFHDFGGKYSGVKMAVNEAISQGKLKDEGLFYTLKVTKKI